MLLLWAGLVVVAPWYFGINGSWKTFLFLVSVPIALIGLGGAATELGKFRDSDSLSGMGVALTFLVLAVGLGVPPLVLSVPTPWDLVMKVGGYACAFVAAMGTCIEIGRRLDVRAAGPKPPRTRPVSEQVLALVVGVLTFSTAVIGFVAALLSFH